MVKTLKKSPLLRSGNDILPYSEGVKMSDKKVSFKFRKFVSFSLMFIFPILVISGVALYIRPEGSIARWIVWTHWGLDKRGWEGIHIIFSIVFVLIMIFHIYFNWDPLMSYIKKKKQSMLLNYRELILSFVFIATIFTLVLTRKGPLWDIMDIRRDYKLYHTPIAITPPEPEFEKHPFHKAASRLNITESKLGKILTDKGLTISGNDARFMDIAKENNMTPEELYAIIKKELGL